MSAVATARLQVVAAAVLWSLSGAFTKTLSTPTYLGLHEPAIDGLAIAFYRVLFAAIGLMPTLRRGSARFRPVFLPMILSFGIMNALFIGAMKLGTAANAILLQYTAPLWLVLAGRFFGDRPPGFRDMFALTVGSLGVAIILAGNWQSERPDVLLMAVGSGVAYAGVLIGLRAFRGESASWLTVLNHLGGAVVLLPIVALLPRPTPGQMAWLALFGCVQMALPYWLMARALREIPAHEAGMITLLEPALNPLWAYLVSPATETPTPATFWGGAFILAALATRYVGFRKPHPA